ncbi:MAG: bifunctional DNA-formamidopyrimidine glycosylase/DNA-(apurinic or apyrimidinic site) lyase [Candidatus Andersenbacteria bacterium]|nr:bifunctional DNA-formamidopyrimidine glycosylase/DNA-(apurinic or apyrimidinic site) lyase [Candidatus Andersenbacteria bacterium]MBI3251265.1 bifunctional DNA-formamidopyrimidine glycosylase/DNA-(apurinic or apyrimidinic site) lyase [Candidatus Andersenbacteria bacterium]
MPELPEVETIRQGLSRRVIRKRIKQVSVRKKKIVRGSATAFEKVLRGNSFAQVGRHGKLLILPLTKGDKVLLIHLKMTGQLIYRQKKDVIAGGHQWPPVDPMELPNKYSHVIMDFTDGSQLFFNDLRQFGFMELADQKRLHVVLDHMGIDPIKEKLTLEKLQALFKKRSTSIKAVLLNQQLIAGIGNIYADEICFMAHVKPTRPVQSLSLKELKSIQSSISRVLERAISYGGTTFRNYLNTEGGKGNYTEKLFVYGRGGKICKRCKKGTITKIRLAGRGTHFCPACQY